MLHVTAQIMHIFVKNKFLKKVEFNKYPRFLVDL